jgi:hypothetical protein
VNGRAHCAHGPVRRRGARSRSSDGGWRGRCVGRAPQQSPYPAGLEGVVFDPSRWVVPPIPTRMMAREWQVRPHAPSLGRRARADRKCNGRNSCSFADSCAPLHNRNARRPNAGSPAGPRRGGPCRHSRGDARVPTYPPGRRAHGARLQTPAQRRAGPAGSRSWTETVALRRDATQNEQACASTGRTEHRSSAVKGLLEGTSHPERSGRVRLPEEKIPDGCGSDEDQRAIGNDTACRHQPTAPR